jgi:hypothetical protein
MQTYSFLVCNCFLNIKSCHMFFESQNFSACSKNTSWRGNESYFQAILRQ